MDVGGSIKLAFDSYWHKKMNLISNIYNAILELIKIMLHHVELHSLRNSLRKLFVTKEFLS